MALLAVRWHTSLATSCDSRSSRDRPMKSNVWVTFRSESTLRKGDCSNCTRKACLRASSNTGSPVVLVKSASTSVSRSVSRWARRW